MLNKLTPNAGAKLVIHKAENPPLPDEKGIDLQPNTETTVAIQKVLDLFQIFKSSSYCILYFI